MRARARFLCRIRRRVCRAGRASGLLRAGKGAPRPPWGREKGICERAWQPYGAPRPRRGREEAKLYKATKYYLCNNVAEWAPLPARRAAAAAGGQRRALFPTRQNTTYRSRKIYGAGAGTKKPRCGLLFSALCATMENNPIPAGNGLPSTQKQHENKFRCFFEAAAAGGHYGWRKERSCNCGKSMPGAPQRWSARWR